MRKVFVGVALLAALFAPLSCGGGGGGERDTSGDVTLDAPPVGAFDGYIVATTPFATVMANVLPGIMVGDLIDLEARGFLSFNIGALPPPPAVVRAAILEIEQWQVTGTPFPQHGQVWIDHVDLGPTFDTLDFDTAPLDSGFAQVSNSMDRRTYTIDVRSQIGADQIAGRTRSSFRLRFNFLSALTPNGVHDTADFNDAEDHAGDTLVPKLTIVYSP